LEADAGHIWLEKGSLEADSAGTRLRYVKRLALPVQQGLRAVLPMLAIKLPHGKRARMLASRSYLGPHPEPGCNKAVCRCAVCSSFAASILRVKT
jgi:hypothetical protein